MTPTVQSTSAGHGAIKLFFYDGPDALRPLSWRDVLDLWANDDAFCATFSATLAETAMTAVFWETPPLDESTLDLAFECVLTASPALAGQRQDPRPFAAHITGNGDDQAASAVVVFANIGGDATLVAPRAVTPGVDHAHLAAFLRSAGAAQTRQLWRSVAEAAGIWLTTGRTAWVSTSGLGVTWLHVRIDPRPKYYVHAPYRRA